MEGRACLRDHKSIQGSRSGYITTEFVEREQVLVPEHLSVDLGVLDERMVDSLEAIHSFLRVFFQKTLDKVEE